MREYFRLFSLERLLWLFLFLLALTATVSVTACQIAYAVAVVLFVVCWRRGLRPVAVGLEWPAALLVGWACFTIFFSADIQQSLIYSRRWYLLLLLWIVATSGRSDQRRAWLLGAVVAGVLIIIGYGCVQLFRDGLGYYHDQSGILYGRLRLAQGYMTAGGLLMETSLVTFAFTLMLSGRRIRIWLTVALLVQLAALVLTMTRSAWLGFFFGTVVILSMRRPRLLPLFLLAVAVSIVFLPPVAKQRAQSLVDPSHEHNVERMQMWQTGVRMMADQPLVGVGDVDLNRIYSTYHEEGKAETVGHLHNNVVMFGVLWGVPGLVLCLVFLVRMLCKLWQRWRQGTATDSNLARGWVLASIGVWVGVMVSGLFEWNFGDSEILTLLLLVVGMGLAPRQSV